MITMKVLVACEESQTVCKAVLISIKPKWCELIANGKKSVEVRKTKPKLKPPFKCYIYCTKAKRDTYFWVGKRYAYVDDRSHNAFDKNGNGKVIGEFICSDIETLRSNTIFNAPALYAQSCMTREEYFEYAADNTVYLWYISNLKIYGAPKELGNFTGLRETKFGAEPVKIVRPPQSWVYTEG